MPTAKPDREAVFWNKFAKYYDSFMRRTYQTQYKDILKMMDDELNKDKTILEVGTGTGDIAINISSIAPTYCHGQNFSSRTVSKIMSIAGFRAYNRWSAESLQAFIIDHGYNIIKYSLLKSTPPLLYIVCTAPLMVEN